MGEGQNDAEGQTYLLCLSKKQYCAALHEHHIQQDIRTKGSIKGESIHMTISVVEVLHTKSHPEYLPKDEYLQGRLVIYKRTAMSVLIRGTNRTRAQS